jgi:hypothetical protein
MSNLEDQFNKDVAANEAEYQACKALIRQQMPELAHVLFDAPICAEHNVPVDQCGCP